MCVIQFGDFCNKCTSKRDKSLLTPFGGHGAVRIFAAGRAGLRQTKTGSRRVIKAKALSLILTRQFVRVA